MELRFPWTHHRMWALHQIPEIFNDYYVQLLQKISHLKHNFIFILEFLFHFLPDFVSMCASGHTWQNPQYHLLQVLQDQTMFRQPQHCPTILIQSWINMRRELSNTYLLTYQWVQVWFVRHINTYHRDDSLLCKWSSIDLQAHLEFWLHIPSNRCIWIEV